MVVCDFIFVFQSWVCDRMTVSVTVWAMTSVQSPLPGGTSEWLSPPVATPSILRGKTQKEVKPGTPGHWRGMRAGQSHNPKEARPI